MDVGAGSITGGHAGDGFVGRERELGELVIVSSATGVDA